VQAPLHHLRAGGGAHPADREEGRPPRGVDRDKVLAGLKKACEKRPVSIEALEDAISEIERKLQEVGEKEIPSSYVGEEIMKRLQGLDEVAYVRFASVYRSFRDIEEFKELIEDQAAKAKDRKGTRAVPAARSGKS
jgi:transcriptional repressor NrdR